MLDVLLVLAFRRMLRQLFGEEVLGSKTPRLLLAAMQ